LPPFPAEDDRGVESRRPLPVLATNRGLGAARFVGPACAVVVLVAGLSPSFEGVAEVAPLAARKVLLTDTGLNEAGFFTVDAVRA
jgi:hypothetical protein